MAHLCNLLLALCRQPASRLAVLARWDRLFMSTLDDDTDIMLYRHSWPTGRRSRSTRMASSRSPSRQPSAPRPRLPPPTRTRLMTVSSWVCAF